MSAFGKRSGVNGGGGQRPAFGVARPMRGPEVGGAQFPPIDSVPLPGAGDPAAMPSDAMQRLTHRQDGSGEAAAS